MYDKTLGTSVINSQSFFLAAEPLNNFIFTYYIFLVKGMEGTKTFTEFWLGWSNL